PVNAPNGPPTPAETVATMEIFDCSLNRAAPADSSSAAVKCTAFRGMPDDSKCIKAFRALLRLLNTPVTSWFTAWFLIGPPSEHIATLCINGETNYSKIQVNYPVQNLLMHDCIVLAFSYSK